MRKQKIITIQDRDQSLTFRITEMPVTKFEGWCIRAASLLLGTGIAKNLQINSSGDMFKSVAAALQNDGLASLGNLDPAKVQPILDDLTACCEQQVGKAFIRLTPEEIDAKIQDIKTLFTLRKEAIALHFGFLTDAAPSSSEKPAAAKHVMRKPSISPLS